MDQEGEGIRRGSPTTIAEELKEWPSSLHHDVAAAEAEGRSARIFDQTEKRRRRKVVITLLAIFIMASGAVVAFLYFWNRPKADPSPSVNKPTSDLQSVEVAEKRPENHRYYKKTEATISSAGQDVFRVVKYDFYLSKFIRNNRSLKNQDVAVKAFKELSNDLKNSWVLIFASASIEGYEDNNVSLCQERLYAVKELLSDTAGPAAKGYWGIIAGEYKMELPDVPPEKMEDEENRIALKFGEKWLEDQRKLIVITIQQIGPLSDQVSKEVPRIVSEQIYEKGMLPRNYDAPAGPPFLLTTD